MNRLLIFFACIFSIHATAQNINKYFDKKKYLVADSINLTGSKDKLFIVFDIKGESTVIYKRNGNYSFYNGFLPCQTCVGRGGTGPTYLGHKKQKNVVILAHYHHFGIDSVYVNFSKQTPTITKIIRREFGADKTNNPEFEGDFVFIAKKSAPINNFNLPVDREDPNVREYFNIKRIKPKVLKF